MIRPARFPKPGRSFWGKWAVETCHGMSLLNNNFVLSVVKKKRKSAAKITPYVNIYDRCFPA